MATIITSDGVVFNIHRDLLAELKTLKMFLEDKENDPDPDPVIPLPNVNMTVFLKIQHFFVNGRLEDYDSVKSVIVADDYLAYEQLIDHCAEYIATRVIKGMTPVQIKNYFKNM